MQEMPELSHMEWSVQMKKSLVATAAILMAALMMPSSVNAGASASAPSKYSQANQGNKQQQADRQTYPITEYSSSTRHHPPKH
jgi:hypothetical protein